MSEKQVKKGFRMSNIIIAAIFVIILLVNAIYIVEEQEQAVIITFGKPSVVTTPGPHIKIPFIQEVNKVPMVIHDLRIGYDETENFVNTESLMITSDYNFVNVDFFLEYKVSDPERYLFASDNPEAIFHNLALSYIRDTIGLHEVDEVITTGKNEIQAEIREKLSARLDEEDIGLQLINITIQDAEPPTNEVKDAFKNVETAKQGKETAINTARKYESEQIPAARAQEDAVLKEAESEKESRINDAKAEVAVFNVMYQEYIKNPELTKLRMYYETMEEVLPSMKIIIDNENGTTSKILPLEPLIDTNSQDDGSTSNSSNSSPVKTNPEPEKEKEPEKEAEKDNSEDVTENKE